MVADLILDARSLSASLIAAERERAYIAGHEAVDTITLNQQTRELFLDPNSIRGRICQHQIAKT